MENMKIRNHGTNFAGMGWQAFNAASLYRTGIQSQSATRIAWHGAGFSLPLPQWHYLGRKGPIQETLWKAALPFMNASIWDGILSNNSNSKQHSLNVTFVKNITTRFIVCVFNPYVFLAAKKDQLQVNDTQLTCKSCQLYHCINHSTLHTHNISTLIILGCIPGLWIPVHLSEPWATTPALHFMKQLLTHLTHCIHKALGIIIFAIVSLVTLITSVVMSSVTLHSSIQTTQYVENWMRMANQVWLLHNKINTELQTEVAMLKSMVLWLEEQVQSLQLQQQLHHHFNHTHICVNNLEYNQSEYPWNLVKAHLQRACTSNITFDIGQLQNKILDLNKQTQEFQPSLEDWTEF